MDNWCQKKDDDDSRFWWISILLFIVSILLLIAIFLSVLIALIAAPADATEPNSSYVFVDYNTTRVAPNVYGVVLDHIPSIGQGDEVYINDTVDISRATGWAGPDGEYRIAYYGMWASEPSPEGLDPELIIKLPGKSRSGTVPTQYKYWIDPSIFADRTGWWYQFYSNSTIDDEGAGNLRAFRVNSTRRTVMFNNNTTVQYGSGEYNAEKPPVEPLMPEKRISDILVARGDEPDLKVAGSRVWVFGRVDGIFGKASNLTKDDVWSLEPGNYNVVLQSPGSNTIYDVTLAGDYLVPGLYGKKPVDVSAAKNDAYVMREKFTEMVSGTDDRLTKYSMQVQEPEITLERIDEIYMDGITVLDIRGYTNAANGTKITVVLDEGRSYKAYIAERIKSTDAIRTNPGHMSYYQVYLPIDYDTLAAADALNHTVTARTAIGGVVYKDFWISVLPADSYKPNATIKYIEGRNPFVPTPTPIVQTVEKVVTKVTVEYRNVTIIEKEPFDYVKLITASVPYIVGSVAALLILIWGVSTVLNARTKHKTETINRRV